MATKESKSDKFNVKIPRMSGEGDVYVSVANCAGYSKTFQIKRGVEVEVERPVAEVLNMAEDAERIEAEFIASNSVSE